MNIPTETRYAIIHALYTSPVFPQQTALLRTCKVLYQEAYPIFIANYPLVCMPVKPGRYTLRCGLGRGDVLNIVYPHDDERFKMHLFEQEWLDGMRTGLTELFDVDDNEEEEEEDEQNGVDKEEEEEENGSEEDEGDYDEIEGFDINDMESTLSERGQQFSRYWIKENPFAKQLRRIGREKVAKMQTIEVNWGGWESNRMGELLQPGPYAVGIMSIVCSLFLPCLTHITLKQTAFGEGEQDIYAREYLVDIYDDADSEDKRWPEESKTGMMGREEDSANNAWQCYMIKALRLLTEACKELKVLELKDWESRGHSKWWKEKFETGGLRVHVEIDLDGPYKGREEAGF